VKRIVGLDGLRGIAVLAVILYHSDLGILNGGFLGVDVFFVLSGFLITSLLINEFESTGRIDRPDFYLRRIRRLVPALSIVLLACVIITGLWVTDAAYEVRRDLPWALTFVLNWSYIFFQQSYFLNMSRPPLFQHLWSLAIEEQFYIVWPLILLGLMRIKYFATRIRRGIIVVALSGIVMSTGLMWYLSVRDGFPIPHDPSRVYFGTDTHASGLLVGCLLAALWRSDKLSTVFTPDRAAAMNLLGFASLGTLAFFFIRTSELTVWLYRYGFLIISLVSAVAVAVIAHPAARFGKLLSNRFFTWLGERSYGLYLWHWPIFQLLRPGIDIDLSPLAGMFLRLGLLVAFAELSYRFIEMPVRNGVVTEYFKEWRDNGLPRPSLHAIALGVVSSLLVGMSLVGLAAAPSPASTLASDLGGITTIDEDPTDLPTQTATPSMSGAPTTSASPHSSSSTHDPLNVRPKPHMVVAPQGPGQVVVFGDSVVLSGHDALKSTLGRISIDAAVGRQPYEIANRIELRRKQKRLSQDIVIHMGTNGLVTSKDLVPILTELQDRRRVVVVNVQVPRVWMKQTNRAIAAIVTKFPNARLANWYSTSYGHKSYFVPDGVHLTHRGGVAFASLIEKVLREP